MVIGTGKSFKSTFWLILLLLSAVAVLVPVLGVDNAVAAEIEDTEEYVGEEPYEVECCPPPVQRVHGLVGEYFDTLKLKECYKRLIRIDENVEFNWQLGSPDEVIEPDTFAVQWTGYIEVPRSGLYTFYTYSDDGVRLMINNRKIIDRWGLVNLEFTRSEPMWLRAGFKYKFCMQYQEDPINSTIFLFWQKEGESMRLVPPEAFWVAKADYDRYIEPVYVNRVMKEGRGLRGEYFIGKDGVNSGDEPIVIVEGQQINFEWGDSSPDPRIPNDDFSARWTGYLEGKFSETVTLQVLTDDGVRIWFDDHLVLDKWIPNSNTLYDVPVDVEAGRLYKIRVEYNELNGGATCVLYWYSDGQEKEVIPVQFLYIPRTPPVSPV